MRSTICLTVLTAALFLSNCAQHYLNVNAFSNNPPQTIGIIIGHDVYARKGLSPEEAILIIEYMLEGKIKGFRQAGEKVEKLSAENMKVAWAESKTFLYDTRTGQRLFYDHVTEDYGQSEDVTVPGALKNLVQLGPIPNSTQ